MQYKIEDDSTAPLTKYERFYKNRENDRKISENNNLVQISDNEDISKYNNPYEDIAYIMNVLSNQDYYDQIIKSLTNTIKSRIPEVASIIEETNFIPFLTQTITNIPPEFENVKVELIKLIHTILDNYKSLHLLFFNQYLLPILSTFIKDTDECNIRILTYSIFSINLLFNSFEQTNTSDFEDCMSITMLCDAYKRIEEIRFIKRFQRYQYEFLKGAIVFTSKICYVHKLSEEDGKAALYLINSALTQDNTYYYKYALKALSYLIENRNIDFDEFDLSQLPLIIYKRITSNQYSNQTFACDIFVALFSIGYFQNHHFSLPVSSILNFIDNCLDEDKNCGPFLRLLAAMIKYDQRGEYILQLYEEKNNYGILTITKSLFKCNFEATEASAHCIIELLKKIEGDLLYESLDKNIVESLVKIIEIGKDFEDNILILTTLQILDKIFMFSQSCDRLQEIKELFCNCSGPEALLDFEQNNYDTDEISTISDKIHSLFDEETW